MTCIICGAEFIPHRDGQKTCGRAECLRINNLRRVQARQRGETYTPPEPRACVVCETMFQPRQPNQITCGDPVCVAGNNKAKKRAQYWAKPEAERAKLRERRAQKKIEPPAMPAVEPEKPEPCHYTMENIALLVGAIFENAYQCRDWTWFDSKEAQFYYDSFGVDKQAILDKIERKKSHVR